MRLLCRLFGHRWQEGHAMTDEGLVYVMGRMCLRCHGWMMP